MIRGSVRDTAAALAAAAVDWMAVLIRLMKGVISRRRCCCCCCCMRL